MNSIKKLLLVAFVISIFANNAFSQKPNIDTSSKADSVTSKLEKINSKLDDVLERIRNNGNDEKQFIGVISMKNDTPIKIYDYSKQQNKSIETPTVKIDKVTMLIKDGYIIDLTAYSKYEKFTNTKAPIAISSRRFSKLDYLQNRNNTSKSILLKDFLNFDPESSFLPEDGFIILTKEKKADSLYRNVGIKDRKSVV